MMFSRWCHSRLNVTGLTGRLLVMVGRTTAVMLSFGLTGGTIRDQGGSTMEKPEMLSVLG